MLSKLSKVTELLLATLPVSIHLLPWALPTITSMIPNSTPYRFLSTKLKSWHLPRCLFLFPSVQNIHKSFFVIPLQKSPNASSPQAGPRVLTSNSRDWSMQREFFPKYFSQKPSIPHHQFITLLYSLILSCSPLLDAELLGGVIFGCEVRR